MEKSMIHKARVISYILILCTLSGCAGLFTHEPLVKKEEQEDVTLAMEVKAKLIETKELSAAAIHVEASNEVVILSGFVETESQRQLAGSITKKVPNVKRVDNKIKVK
jgi:hyperosmotically inducible protein